MKKDSISAYDLKKRVEIYDRDMDIMHPNRYKMVDIALQFIPFDREDQFQALDLGIGTGFFAKKFFEEFPNAHLVGLDGAASMIELAKTLRGIKDEHGDLGGEIEMRIKF